MAWTCLTLANFSVDILDKAIVAEELIVRKAGGKYKMLPLFTETTTKIRAVSHFFQIFNCQ
jgi:obg-like ATPase 1